MKAYCERQVSLCRHTVSLNRHVSLQSQETTVFILQVSPAVVLLFLYTYNMPSRVCTLICKFNVICFNSCLNTAFKMIKIWLVVVIVVVVDCVVVVVCECGVRNGPCTDVCVMFSTGPVPPTDQIQVWRTAHQRDGHTGTGEFKTCKPYIWFLVLTRRALRLLFADYTWQLP